MIDKIKTATRAAMLAVATVSVAATGAAAQLIQIDPGKFQVLPDPRVRVTRGPALGGDRLS